MDIELALITDPARPEGIPLGKIRISMRKLTSDPNVTLNRMMRFAKDFGLFSPIMKRDESLFGGYIRETGSGNCLVAR